MTPHMPRSKRLVMEDALVDWFDKMITSKIDNSEITENLINNFETEIQILDFDKLEALYHDHII